MFNLGTYEARGEGLEELLRGTNMGLLIPDGGEGVLDSRLDDGLGCLSLSLLKEECLGSKTVGVVVATVSTLCRWPCIGRRIGRPAFSVDMDVGEVERSIS